MQNLLRSLKVCNTELTKYLRVLFSENGADLGNRLRTKLIIRVIDDLQCWMCRCYFQDLRKRLVFKSIGVKVNLNNLQVILLEAKSKQLRQGICHSIINELISDKE